LTTHGARTRRQCWFLLRAPSIALASVSASAKACDDKADTGQDFGFHQDSGVDSDGGGDADLASGLVAPTSCLPNPDRTHPPGTDRCGDGDDGCCDSILIQGGSFFPNNCHADAGCSDTPTAIVTPYALDKFEVTVGRFRRFLESGRATAHNAPPVVSGQHPSIPFSGWLKSYDDQLPASEAQLQSELEGCSEGTWHSTDPRLPITCVSWYLAMAFCIWDGGRLPTEAEWNFAAVGGDEQRAYPWPDTVGGVLPAGYCPLGTVQDGAPPTIANFECSGAPTAGPVGSMPLGSGRFGHADLAGNAFEWVLDTYQEPPPFPCKPGSDCASVTGTSGERVLRGGSFRHSEYFLRNSVREKSKPAEKSAAAATIGFRCARDPG